MTCTVCNGQRLHYANCPLRGAEVYSCTTAMLHFPSDVTTATDTLIAEEGAIVLGQYGTKFDLAQLIGAAILAERKRCADVANERALHLAKGAEAIPGDVAFATQMVEALLIEQRITQGWVAKDTMRVEGLHK